MTRHAALLDSDLLAARLAIFTRRRARDRRPRGPQPRHDRRRALPGRPVRGPVRGLRRRQAQMVIRSAAGGAGRRTCTSSTAARTRRRSARPRCSSRSASRAARRQRVREGRPPRGRLGGGRRRRLARRSKTDGSPRPGIALAAVGGGHHLHAGRATSLIGETPSDELFAARRRSSPRAACDPVTDQRGLEGVQASRRRRPDRARAATRRVARTTSGGRCEMSTGWTVGADPRGRRHPGRGGDRHHDRPAGAADRRAGADRGRRRRRRARADRRARPASPASTTPACASCTPRARCGRWRWANERLYARCVARLRGLALIIGLVAALIVAGLLVALIQACRSIEGIASRACSRSPARSRPTPPTSRSSQATAPVLGLIVDEAIVQDGYMNALTDGYGRQVDGRPVSVLLAVVVIAVLARRADRGAPQPARLRRGPGHARRRARVRRVRAPAPARARREGDQRPVRHHPLGAAGDRAPRRRSWPRGGRDDWWILDARAAARGRARGRLPPQRAC